MSSRASRIISGNSVATVRTSWRMLAGTMARAIRDVIPRREDDAGSPSHVRCSFMFIRRFRAAFAAGNDSARSVEDRRPRLGGARWRGAHDFQRDEVTGEGTCPPLDLIATCSSIHCRDVVSRREQIVARELDL